ncbi:MAG TPA: serine hydrolase, partial [Blastocatellia bacterium]|nr:serine hydrolase [Blastocatellia bacterium]
FDPAYLSRYTGAYDLMGQTISVSLKGAALVAVIGAQPPVDLVPALGGDFTLKQVQVVSLHFVMDDKGTAASFELRQPGTVLTAKRKP